MNRKRKLPKVIEEKENHACSTTISQGPMYTILCSAQQNETQHKRYVKEMQRLYNSLDHDAFMYTFIKMLKTVLEAEETNEYGNAALSFCAKFVSSFDCEGTHRLLNDVFKWLLSTISNNPHIRYRLCFFVNKMLKEFGQQAALDDEQCDAILEYMLDRMRDVSSGVRKQAALAMQRLQVPDNPDDPVLRAYQFHLCSDPSPSVRQVIITCMGRNYHTIPHILERLWDIDEKVRRHTYVNMCSYPVRSYKVSQRLTLLEQGLNDSSEGVRKTVVKFMLKQWLESYDNNITTLTAALKLDSSDEEMERFRKVAKQMLYCIFEQKSNDELLEQLPLAEEGELTRCVPQDKANVEVLLYWQCLNEYFQKTDAPEHDQVLPELSTFCSYVEKFSQLQTAEMDKFVQIEFQYMLLSLIEILRSYDLGDEIGRGNMKLLLRGLLKNCLLDHKIIALIAQCTDSLMFDVSERFQFFLEIIYDVCELNPKQFDLVHDRNLLSKLLDNLDADLKTKISSLKVKILDLEEQEQVFVTQKEYIRAQAKNDEKNAITEEYMALLKPLLEKDLIAELPERPKFTKQESILKGLYITFYMVSSDSVTSLDPSSCKLFHDFICRHMASNESDIREWAIKCGTAYSMLYETFAKEVFDVLYIQFYKSINLRVWETAVSCVFELLDRYGVDNFSVVEQPSKRRRPGRQLYNNLDFLDAPEDSNVSNSGVNSGDAAVGVIYMMSHFLDQCSDNCIIRSIVKGFSRLILHGHLKDRTDVLEKLLKIYFNPATDTSINQVLGVFFEHLVDLKLQSLLQPCLVPLLTTIMSANFDSSLSEVNPQTVIKFIIDITQQEVTSPSDNIHNKIALSFLHEMHNNLKERKDLCKILAKEITALKLNIGNNMELKNEMMTLADKLIKAELDPKSIRSIINFKGMLNGVFQPPAKKRSDQIGESDDECDSETVTTTSEYAAPTECDDYRLEDNASSDKEKENTTLTNTTNTNARLSNATSLLNDGGSGDNNENVASEDAERTLTNERSSHETETTTTFGHDNRTGHMSLRRSLQKSASDTESDGTLSGPGHCKKSRKIEDQEEKKRTQELSQRNIEKYKIIKQPIVRLQRTPEDKKKTAQGEKSAEKNKSNQNNDETVENDTESENDELRNSSDVITASPTASSPPSLVPGDNVSRLRQLRSSRKQMTTSNSGRSSSDAKVNTQQQRQQQSQQEPVTKRSIVNPNERDENDDEMTPRRNGRKRVLRKSPKSKQQQATPTTRSQRGRSDKSLSPPTESPIRKQQRINNGHDKDDVNSTQTAMNNVIIRAQKTIIEIRQTNVDVGGSDREKSLTTLTASPTGSTTSSKENEVPASNQLNKSIIEQVVDMSTPTSPSSSPRVSVRTPAVAAQSPLLRTPKNQRQQGSPKKKRGRPPRVLHNVEDEEEATTSKKHSDTRKSITSNKNVTFPIRQNTTVVTTRNSARKQRLNSIVMTRKRLSIELNSSLNGSSSSSGYSQSKPSPKRQQIEKPNSSRSNISSNSSRRISNKRNNNFMTASNDSKIDTRTATTVVDKKKQQDANNKTHVDSKASTIPIRTVGAAAAAAAASTTTRTSRKPSAIPIRTRLPSARQSRKNK